METVRSEAPEAQVTGERAGFATVPVVIVVLAVAALLSALSPRYGFHRDELYFLVAGHHPAWGYVDQPPLTPLIARAATTIFGDTPAGLRVVATLACAVTVLLVAMVARELNGGQRAQTLAAFATAASAFVLAVGHMVSTATFDLLAWVVITWLALRLLRTGDGRWWLALGAAVGLATLNKYLVGLLVIALLAAVLATGPRTTLRSPWLVPGVIIAAVTAGPSLWWQARHGWPQLTVAGGISSDDGAENRVMFVPMQIAYLSPLLVPVWIAGFRRLWRDPGLRWARAIGPAYLVLCVLVVASGGKPYYALPLLLVLTAAGAISRYGPGYHLPTPYSGHMSNAEWGPPPDSANGPVVLVFQHGGDPGPQFRGCREVGQVDTGKGVDNEEQGASVTLCSGRVKPWSAIWPSLRRYY